MMRAGHEPDAEEDAFTLQLYGNPVAWGITLVALGSIFLARTLLGVQFPVRRALPVALVILGAYMLFDYLKRRRRREEMRAFDTNSPPPSVVASWPSASGRVGNADFPRQLGSTRVREIGHLGR